ncbi:S49 family peptidase [Sulfurivermis fontis]|uniref:S49 family peptidase n=1 Tax=Sulfurivermis fontis TaxID=1972068 RepID=UPI000FDBB2E0
MMEPNEPNKPADTGWERDVLNRLAFASLNEQRRARRWSIFFKGLMFLYLFALLALMLPGQQGGSVKLGRHTALVEVKGIIADGTEASADNIVTGLRKAFEDKNTAGVILRINSPGGSPVQSGYVYDEIKRLRAKYPAIPLYAVVSDMCASGGYYIAAAADSIYANKASVVGSIGVLMNGFGFVDAMDKLGVERRLLTAGEHKGFLDPFSPSRPEDVAHIKTILGDIHTQFITAVKEGRGARLKDDPILFSGLVWTGEQGMELGLVDGLASASEVARDVIGAENIVDFTPRPHYFEKLAASLGTAMANGMGTVLGMGQIR